MKIAPRSRARLPTPALNPALAPSAPRPLPFASHPAAAPPPPTAPSASPTPSHPAAEPSTALTLPASAGHPLASTFGSLVAEVAANIEPVETILERYDISASEYAELQALPSFQAAVLEAQREFSAIANTPSRVRLKAQLITELLLPAMHEIASSNATPSAARVSAFSAVRSLTGLEKPETPVAQQKFSLTINLGDKGPLTLEGTAQAVPAGRAQDADDPSSDASSVTGKVTQRRVSTDAGDAYAGEALLDAEPYPDDDDPPPTKRSVARAPARLP